MSKPLSVIVVPLVRGVALECLLRAFERPAALPTGCELLVVDSRPPPGGMRGAAVWVEVQAEVPVPRRRALGARVASGEVLAFLEDTTRPDIGWASAIVALHRAHPEAAAIGGCLRLDPRLPPRGVALALLEYGAYLRAGRVAEPALALPGNNLSFKRSSLERAGITGGAPLRESELLREMCNEAGAVRLDSRMAATFAAVDPRMLQLRSRFQHGRLYAGNRWPRSSRLRRWAFAAMAPALPALILFRSSRRIRHAPFSRRFLVALHASSMAVAWSVGEFVGYLWGPGRSEEAWT